MRTIARKYVKNTLSMADLEADIKRKFDVDMGGAMDELQAEMNKSIEIYAAARTHLEAQEGYKDLLAFADLRPDPSQESDDFVTVFSQAKEAQAKLTGKVAFEWRQVKPTLRQAVAGRTAAAWIENVDDPGVKGEQRSREKMQNDYGGHANKLKDLARLTLRFTSAAKMLEALKELTAFGFEIVICKNKYASPTPMGYSDFNLVIKLILESGVAYLSEMQLNLQLMVDAKKEAHVHYEVIRKQLPLLCEGTKIDAATLENYIMERLNNSALDAAVAALLAKAEGLFLYAHLLDEHLNNQVEKGAQIDFASLGSRVSIPAGLGGVYAANFARAFPKGAGGPRWAEARPLIELITAACEPITEAMAAALLKWDEVQKERILEATALVFPVRDGTFHVFHKTVVDWLTGDVAEDSSIQERSAEFQVERQRGHATLANGFLAWLEARDATTPADGERNAAYWLRHGIVHLCRADGRAAEAAEVYATDFGLLCQRLDAGLLASVAKDFVELRLCEGADLAVATEMRRFVGKYTDVLQREGSKAVLQLASQQPDGSAVFRAARRASSEPMRALKWRNKPQKSDACIATLSHKSGVAALAVSAHRLVGGAGHSLFVYDTETQLLLEELEGQSNVKSVAIWECKDGAKGESLLVAGYEDGTINVWDAGVRPTAQLPIFLTKSDQTHSRLLTAASLNEIGSTGAGSSVLSVDFDKGGRMVVSGLASGAIKVWDAVDVRPHVESEWAAFSKEVNTAPSSDDMEYEPKLETQTWWRNNITGHELAAKPSGGECKLQTDQSLMCRCDVLPKVPCLS